MPTRLTIARHAATHAIEIHCTQDDCAAVVVGPLPEEWLADPDTGDVLCPQHRAQAVWFEIRTALLLDGIDQGSSAPTAVLRETSDPQRPGLIGDETLPMRPRGRR